LYNVYKGILETDILDALDIEKSFFPETAAATAVAGGVSASASRHLGLSAGTRVITGSSDGTTAMYGAGVLDESSAVLVSGTTDVLMMSCKPAPTKADRVLSINSGLLPGTYLVRGPLGLSGGCLQYFEQMLQTSVGKLSDATGLEVQKLSISEATCLGTAIFCKAGLDKTGSLQDISSEWIKAAKRFTPNPECTQTYKNLSRLFEHYIEATADLYQGLNEFKQQIKTDKTS
jgi:sugar (pentulose or hexulose) kinase